MGDITMRLRSVRPRSAKGVSRGSSELFMFMSPSILRCACKEVDCNAKPFGGTIQGWAAIAINFPAGGSMDTLNELVAIRAIEGTKARYCRFMDTKRWDDWGRLFTENAVLDVSEDVTPEMGPQVIHGRAAIVAQVRGVVETARTTHQVHSPEISVVSATTATGIWAMHDVV